jgi:hypothetical protein
VELPDGQEHSRLGTAGREEDGVLSERASATGDGSSGQVNDERRHALLVRVRDCARVNDVECAYPPATPAQVHAAEFRLGFPVPPLLRLLYTEVANGGPGVGWPDDTEAFVGADGGFPLAPDDPSTTLGYRASHSTWRMHPCIEAALANYPRHHVVVDSWPDRFFPLANGGLGYLLLDGWTGRIYSSWEYGDLPEEAPDGKPLSLCAIQIAAWSLEDLLDDWLAHAGSGPRSEQFQELPSDAQFGPLSPDQLDPMCADGGAAVWRGLYRDVSFLFDPEEPEEADQSIPSN